MGGLGTIKFVANHPEKFGGAAVLSVAPVDFTQPAHGSLAENIKNQYIRANQGLENTLASPDNVWERLRVNKEQLLPLYFACGTADAHYTQVYLPFKAYAEKEQLPITFRETEGYDHEWRFWDLEIQRALEFFGL